MDDMHEGVCFKCKKIKMVEVCKFPFPLEELVGPLDNGCVELCNSCLDRIRDHWREFLGERKGNRYDQ